MMGNFKSAVITKKGQNLLAKVISGNTVFNFTKIAITDNDNSAEDLASLAEIGTIRQHTPISAIVKQNNSNVKISAAFYNRTLTQGYYVKTIGLYATDPDEGEILYSVSVADESMATADWMPPFNGIGVSSLEVNLVTAVSNSDSVNVDVDPSALATVTQVRDIQEQVDTLKTFVGYDEEDVYGVEVDFENNKFTRLAGAKEFTAGDDFSNINPWKRRRCNVADDGTVKAYYEDAGYKEDGSNGMVMVEQPIFYVKVVPVKSKAATSGKGKELLKARYYISPTPKVGFKAPDAFKDSHGILQDKIYLSAYEGSLYDTSASAYITNDAQVADFAADKMVSIAGAKPASGLSQNLTRANVRKLCNNRGAGWQSHNIYALAVTQWLILVEYASFDCQRNIGRGVCDFTDDGSTNMALNTGDTSSLGNGSGNAEGGVDGKCSVSYRGEENLWGNIWTWLDLINILAKGANEAYLHKAGGTVADDTTTGYESYGTQLSHSNGYQSRVGYSEEHPDLFLPTASAGTDALPIGDYYWQSYTYSGFLVAVLGGRWDDGSTGGAWCLYVVNASSHRYRSIGGRLLYVPQTKVA